MCWPSRTTILFYMHPLLHDEVRRLFAWGEAEGASDLACSFHHSQDYDHGRKEVRRCWATAQMHWLDETDEPAAWAGLRSVAKVESQRTVNGKTTTECRYFLSSLPADANLRMLKSYWLRCGSIGASKIVCTGFWTWPLPKIAVVFAKIMPHRTWQH